MSKNYISHDCTEQCRSYQHSDAILSAITQSFTDNQVASYIYATCANCGHVVDRTGRSALHLAAAMGRKELCRWLIKIAKADINLKDKDSGYTALHHSIYSGNLHVAVFLAKCGANLNLADNEDLRPIDYLLLRDNRYSICSSYEVLYDSPEFLRRFNKLSLYEIYMWGTNSNYNLGTGTQQSRAVPELLEPLKRKNIYKVSMHKFHTVILTNDGKVWVCGHGQGGRLGLKNESSAVSLKKLNFGTDIVIDTCVSQDHSLFLTNSGSVFVCGLNSYHQLGLSPAPVCIDTPTVINAIRPSIPLCGICCGRFHSVVYSTKEVFTFGTNLGQLGHPIPNSIYIKPKLINDFLKLEQNDSITDVVACDTATVILVNMEYIYLLYQFKCVKYTPLKFRKSGLDRYNPVTTIKQICVSGGRFKDVTAPPNHNGDLKIAVLSLYGEIFLWTESCRQFTRCVFVSLRNVFVIQFLLQSDLIAFVSRNGQAYKSELTLKLKTFNNPEYQKKPNGEYLSAEDLLYIGQTSYYMIKVERVPNITRGIKISSDPKGYNFSVLQTRPLDALLDGNPEINSSSSTFKRQLKTLLDDASELDQLHDVIFQVGYERFPAHKYIIASRCKALYDLCLDGKEDHDVVIENVNSTIFKQILEYIYTNDCDLLDPVKTRLLLKNENQIKLAMECANKFKLERLYENLHGWKISQPSQQHRPLKCEEELVFDRHTHQQLYDVSIAGCDGTIIKAHRCILAKVEYFYSMLCGGWIESSCSEPVQLSIPGSVLNDVINFLYTNTPSRPLNYDNVEYWTNLLAVADQLLIDGLKECCTTGLINSLSLKNAPEILSSSINFKSKLLETTVMDFIVLNIASFFESGILENFSDSLMKDLVGLYKRKLKKRIVDIRSFPHNSDEFCEIIKGFPNPWKDLATSEQLIKLNSKPSRRRRKSTMSEDESVNRSQDYNSSISEQIDLSYEESTEVSKQKEEKENKINEEKFVTVKKQNKYMDAQVKIMNALKKSPDLMDLESNFVKLKALSSCQPIIPPPSLKDSSHFPTLSLSTSPDACVRRRSSDQKKSKRSPQSVGTKKLTLKDLDGHLDKIDSPINIPPSSSSLPSTAVWGSCATSPPTPSSSWRTIESDVPQQSLSEILKETKMENLNKSFSEIMTDEAKKKENFIRMTSKCLGFIQLEDRAIEELKLFYNTENSFDETFTVSRVIETDIAAPMWYYGKNESPR